MSATIEAEKLASYFDAPVIEVPGRAFPVEERKPGCDITSDAACLLRSGRNVLVFQPGKAEIAKTIADLKAMSGGVDAEILPLHGELTPDEQQAAFKKYGRAKCVVATNVAQTSVTIDDIDAVVDSGLERRIELVNGVEGLYLGSISRADAKQRKGRAGRTKPGVYIDHCDEYDRPEFPTAEILRTRLDQTVLRLAEAGFDALELEFFHQPDRDDIHEAKRALVALGCMDSNGKVTRKGQRVATMPISVETACMVIEAERLGVVDDVLTVAAILEIGEITANKDEHGLPSRTWRELCPGEQDSDVLAQLAVYKAACEMKKDDLRKRGVHVKAFFKVKEVRRHLADSLRGRVREFRSSGKREDIMRAVCAGMVDHLFRFDHGTFSNGGHQGRALNRDSVVGSADWLVGVPWDLQIQTRRGTRVLNLIRMATRIRPEWLADVAPQLVERKTGLRPRFSQEKDLVVSVTETHFNGQMIREEIVADSDHPQAADIFCEWLAAEPQYAQNKARELNHRVGDRVFQVMSPDEIKRWLKERLLGARRMAEVLNLNAIALPELDAEMVARVMGENPNEIAVLGKMLKVKYRDGYAPRVTLDRETITAHGWKELPDQGLKLPGGRPVEIIAPFGYYDWVIGQDIPKLKTECAKRAHRQLWEDWPQEGRPMIALPDPVGDPTSIIPEIVECRYGVGAIDGTPLLAYGTIAYDRYQPFVVRWFQTREEAEAARAKAVIHFESLREVAIRQNERKAFYTAREALGDLQSREGWNDLDPRLRTRVADHCYSHAGPDQIVTWTQETNDLIAEVENALRLIAEQKVEAEAAKREAEERDREKYAVILNCEWYKCSVAKAREIDAFVRDCIALRGATRTADILRKESEKDYGRARRAEAIQGQFRGLNHRGLDWASGRDIVLSADWAEHLVRTENASAPPADANQVATRDALKVRFGKKH
jgi:ATP-dependent helicase HrpB